jgi:hypothetical protein
MYSRMTDAKLMATEKIRGDKYHTCRVMLIADVTKLLAGLSGAATRRIGVLCVQNLRFGPQSGDDSGVGPRWRHLISAQHECDGTIEQYTGYNQLSVSDASVHRKDRKDRIGLVNRRCRPAKAHAEHQETGTIYCIATGRSS